MFSAMAGVAVLACGPSGDGFVIAIALLLAFFAVKSLALAGLMALLVTLYTQWRQRKSDPLNVATASATPGRRS